MPCAVFQLLFKHCERKPHISHEHVPFFPVPNDFICSSLPALLSLTPYNTFIRSWALHIGVHLQISGAQIRLIYLLLTQIHMLAVHVILPCLLSLFHFSFFLLCFSLLFALYLPSLIMSFSFGVPALRPTSTQWQNANRRKWFRISRPLQYVPTSSPPLSLQHCLSI